MINFIIKPTEKPANADIFWSVTSLPLNGNFLGKERQQSEIGLRSQATQWPNYAREFTVSYVMIEFER